MKIIGIYKITNKINGKCYIGQSINVEKRLKSHFSLQQKNKKYLLHRAITKYGADNFDKTILEECSRKELNDKEIFYIKKYNSFKNGYNLNSGGDAPTEISLETRKKLAIAGSGKNSHWYGKHLTDEHKIKLGKKIFCIELNKSFDTIQFASNELGIPHSTISASIINKRKIYNKYTFIKK